MSRANIDLAGIREKVSIFRTDSGIFWVLASIGLTLSIASVAAYAYGYFAGDSYYIEFVAQKFRIDAEQNVPTWYSSSLMLTAGLLSLLNGALLRSGDLRAGSGWLLFGLFLIGLSIDESAGFHEEIFDWLMPILEIEFVHFWVIPAAPIVVVILVLFARFVQGLADPSRSWILTGIGTFFLGALVFEAAGGLVAETFTKQSYLYMACTHTEETLEFLGMAMVVQGACAALTRA